MTAALKQTPLHALHQQYGARLVPFAGYEMPVQYATGIIQEHLHTRAAASLFDVSHMGQIEISGPHAKTELERLLPLDLDKLSLSQLAYSFLPNEAGGVIDDVIVLRRNRDNFVLVVNAGCKDKVIQHLTRELATSPIHILNDHALLALQGPKALDVLGEIFHEDIARLPFMHGMLVKTNRVECFLSRSGYTGEDGFEISVPTDHAEILAKEILEITPAQLAGLGARDSLRLEAGLCLYDHELSEEVSPVAAGIGWTVSKQRREGKKSGGFLGADKILHQLKSGTPEQRVGLSVQSKVPVREGAVVCDDYQNEVGEVTSGTFSPTLQVPIAMAYVDHRVAKTGTLLHTEVRGKPIDLIVTHLPFVKHRYMRT